MSCALDLLLIFVLFIPLKLLEIGIGNCGQHRFIDDKYDFNARLYLKVVILLILLLESIEVHLKIIELSKPNLGAHLPNLAEQSPLNLHAKLFHVVHIRNEARAVAFALFDQLV